MICVRFVEEKETLFVEIKIRVRGLNRFLPKAGDNLMHIYFYIIDRDDARRPGSWISIVLKRKVRKGEQSMIIPRSDHK